jgi:phosphate acyltransferase
MTRLAIDGMGGDYAPKMVVDGLSLFHAQDPSVEFLLYGDEVSLKKALDPYGSLRQVVEVIPTTEIVTSDIVFLRYCAVCGAKAACIVP